MNGIEAKIEYSNYGDRSSVIEDCLKMDAYIRSSAGMYCPECSKKGKKIFSQHVVRTGNDMKTLCDTCYKRHELRRKLSM